MGLVARPVVEHKGYGMRERENFAQQPTRQMPAVMSPHALDAVATSELRENGVDAVAKTAQIGALSRMRVISFVSVWCHEFDALPIQILYCLRRAVVAVSDHDAGGALEEFGDDREFMYVGWCHREEVGYDPEPADPHVHPKAVEGVLEKRVLAEKAASPQKRRHR
jgi:hypothetical protein